MKKKVYLFSSFIFLSLLSIASFKCQSFWISQVQVNDPKHSTRPYVILVSVDGYRFDYNKIYRPTHLSTFFKDGVWAKGLIPVFPSKTFPNHYSIITGLKPENHGIVANQFWDPQRQEQYSIGQSNILDGTWYGGEPIWIAAHKEKMLSASYFWIGSEADIQGRHPTYYYPYSNKTPSLERVQQVLKWLKLPREKRPHFMTLYFSSVDSAGHRFSPDSSQVDLAIQDVDEALGLLFKEIEKSPLPINIIVVSDHGMETITKNKYLYLDDYISLEGVRVVGKGSHSLLYVDNQKRRQNIYKKLKKVKPIHIYPREKMPKSYGYSNNPRIGDFVLSMDPGYYLELSRPYEGVPRQEIGSGPWGTHGYDTQKSSRMRGVFFAKGPHIKPLGEIEAFENIHIYPLIMDILGLEIKTKIDGKREVLSQKLLKKER